MKCPVCKFVKSFTIIAAVSKYRARAIYDDNGNFADITEEDSPIDTLADGKLVAIQCDQCDYKGKPEEFGDLGF